MAKKKPKVKLTLLRGKDSQDAEKLAVLFTRLTGKPVTQKEIEDAKKFLTAP